MSTEITEETEQREEILLKAVVTTTDQGLFEAVISTEGFDRENDRVSAAGMVKALSKWPRAIPLTWEHGEEPKDIIGTIDPTSAQAVGGEVVAKGKIDLESRLGGDAWPAFKAKSIAFSFHFMFIAGKGARKNAQGGMDIMEFDVFEITSTRTPINNGTRVLGTKSAEPASEADLRKATDKAEREQIEARLAELPEAEPAPGPIDELRAELAEMTVSMKALTDRLDEQQQAAEIAAKKIKELTRTGSPVDELKQRSDQTILALATDGASLRKSTPAKKPESPPEPASQRELQQRSYEVTLALLTTEASDDPQ